jgi:pyruvate-formate lyase-activating enzyme
MEILEVKKYKSNIDEYEVIPHLKENNYNLEEVAKFISSSLEESTSNIYFVDKGILNYKLNTPQSLMKFLKDFIDTQEENKEVGLKLFQYKITIKK